MGMNLAYKILSSKLKDGNLVPGEQIGIQIDQTLTQDSTGTIIYTTTNFRPLWEFCRIFIYCHYNIAWYCIFNIKK